MMASTSTIVCSDFGANGCTLTIADGGDVYIIGSFHRMHEEGDTPQKLSLKNIKSIKGGYHVLCLDIEGNAFSFGDNLVGQLGRDCRAFAREPQRIDLPPVIQIGCGRYFSACLTETGSVFSFGSNYSGQLGHGDNESLKIPKQIETLQDIEFLTCGGDYTICKSVNNDVYAFGYNTDGQLGIGNKQDQTIPVKCENWPDYIIDIKCGFNHTIILTSKQEVFSCGSNLEGQLGRESTDSDIPLKIPTLSEIIRIECGFRSVMCIDINNDLYVFGENKYGQLGLGDKSNRFLPIQHPSLSNIIDISKGGDSTFVKTSNNEIYAFGSNDSSSIRN